MNKLPFGYLLDPYKWVRGTVLEDEDSMPGDPGYTPGIFHVTSRLTEVMASGELKARRQLKGKVGLGGGLGNEAPDLVSFVPDLDRARWLADAMIVAAEAAWNMISATEVIESVLNRCDFPTDYDRWTFQDPEYEEIYNRGLYSTLLDVSGEFGLDVDDPESLLYFEGWKEALQQQKERVESTFHSGKLKYELIQKAERLFGELETDYSQRIFPSVLVGFTASWDAFSMINPMEIAVLQCGVRESAPGELNPGEQEIRFPPEDVILVSHERMISWPVPVPEREL